MIIRTVDGDARHLTLTDDTARTGYEAPIAATVPAARWHAGARQRDTGLELKVGTRNASAAVVAEQAGPAFG